MDDKPRKRRNRWIRPKNVLRPDWFMSNPRTLMDVEYNTYLLEAARGKYDKQINDGRTDNMFEVLFHMMNLNSLTYTGRAYDYFFRAYDKPEVETFREQVLEYGRRIEASIPISDRDPGDSPSGDKPKATPGFEIMKKAREVFMAALHGYLSLTSEACANIELYQRNPFLHEETKVFAVINVKPHDVYEVWEIDVDAREPAGKMRNIGVLCENMRPLEGMGPNNTALASLDRPMDHRDVASAVRNVLLMNRFFVGLDGALDPDIADKIINTIKEKRSFPYSLVIT